jgi:hypothetical protein
MARLPSRVQMGAFGAAGAVNLTATPVGRAPVPRPLLLQPGPATPIAQTIDRQANDIQQNARTANQVSRALPFANGNLLEGLSLASGDNVIAHGLGAAFRNAFLIGPSAHVTYTVSQGTNPSKTCVINLSAPCVADIWIYS